MLCECICGECAHEQHIRRTLTLTLTLSHTITAYLVSGGGQQDYLLISGCGALPHKCQPPSPPLENIRVMVIVWRLRGNIIRSAPCWVVRHSVHSQQHTHMSSSYRSSRLGLSHWDAYAMHRGSCLELYYCNMVEWSWWDSSFVWKTN